MARDPVEAVNVDVDDCFDGTEITAFGLLSLLSEELPIDLSDCTTILDTLAAFAMKNLPETQQPVLIWGDKGWTFGYTDKAEVTKSRAPRKVTVRATSTVQS